MSNIGDILRSKQPTEYRLLKWRYPEPEMEEDKREFRETARDMNHDQYKREHGAIRQK